MKKYKILLIDLDDTLTNTISGNTFPKGVWDMKFDFEVLDKIKEYGFERICIVTNQGGVEKGFVNRYNWIKKIDYICACIKEYTGIINCDYEVCVTNCKDCQHRKPNIGMFVDFLSKLTFLDRVINYFDEALMVGDASGLPGQFSDSDKKFAENARIDYMDVNDFKKLKINS